MRHSIKAIPSVHQHCQKNKTHRQHNWKMSATDVSNRGARGFFLFLLGAETDIYIRKLRITGSSLSQTTAKQTAVNIHAETPNKKSTHPADELRCFSNRRRCPRRAKVCVFELHLLPPRPSQWQFKLNGSGEMICTCLWLFRNVKCGDTGPPPPTADRGHYLCMKVLGWHPQVTFPLRVARKMHNFYEGLLNWCSHYLVF